MLRRVALLALALCASVLAGAGAVASAVAAPAKAAVARVDVLSPVWTPVTGDVAAGVQVRLASDVNRLNVRLRLYDDEQNLLWQRTQSRRSLSGQTYVFSFAKPVRDLGLKPGVYLLRAQVRAGAAAPVEATATLLIADPKTRAVPVSVVVRVAGLPARDPAGTFVVDPLQDGGTREAAEALSQLAMLRPDLRLSAAIPPVLLEDWRDAGNGYTLAGSQGTATVSADGTGALACRGVLDTLGRASVSGLSLLRGMYAEPDPEGLVRTGDSGRIVADQLALGARVASDAIGAARATSAGDSATRSLEPTGLAVLGDVLPSAAASPVAGAGVGFALLDPSCVSLGGTRTAAPGLYALRSATASATSGLRVLALDRVSSRLLADPAGASALRTHLLQQALSKAGADSPIVIEITVGPGGAKVADLQPALASLARLPWIRLVDAPTAAGMKASPASLSPAAKLSPQAPAGYWDDVTRALSQARALQSAAGPGDPDAAGAVRDAVLATSRCWAGPGGPWSEAERGRAYARAAEDTARRTLSAVHVDIPAVTLSGSAGKVPVSIQNGSAKVLAVVITSRSPKIRLPKVRITAVLRPGENILSVPVDLGPVLSAPLSIAVSAEDVRLAESTTTVRASYLDRLVVLAAVVSVLLMLLWYIRVKARPALARRRARADDSERETAQTPERHGR